MSVRFESSRGEAEDEVAELFRGYVERVAAGEDEDFDAFCVAHAEHAEGLRERKLQWEAILLDLGGLPAQSRALESGAGPGQPLSLLLDELSSRRAAHQRYEPIEELARGGMGAVERVWDRDVRRELARKSILAERLGESGAAAERALGRFMEEAQITGQLDHPGIVPVHEIGLDAEGRPYFTMKLVEGDDLRDCFAKVRGGQEGWTRERALGVLLRMCEALAFAHSKGVIHRDLKPSNVMVGRFGEVYVMDWGLARVVGASSKDAQGDEGLRPVRSALRDPESSDSALLTADGAVIGTPAYMPPEQARGALKAIGPHSDVYAAGAMLYQLLAGEPPYSETSGTRVLEAVRTGPPLPLSRAAPEAPPELVAICERAMQREPGRRYADMHALAEDLRAFLEHRVVQAYRTGTWVEVAKWVRRNPWLAGTSTLLVLVSLVGALVGLRLAREARHEAERAREGAYAARMVAASAQWNDGRLLAAESLLEAMDPARRGWEWSMLRALTVQTKWRTQIDGFASLPELQVASAPFADPGETLFAAGEHRGHRNVFLRERDGVAVADMQTLLSLPRRLDESGPFYLGFDVPESKLQERDHDLILHATDWSGRDRLRVGLQEIDALPSCFGWGASLDWVVLAEAGFLRTRRSQDGAVLAELPVETFLNGRQGLAVDSSGQFACVALPHELWIVSLPELDLVERWAHPSERKNARAFVGPNASWSAIQDTRTIYLRLRDWPAERETLVFEGTLAGLTPDASTAVYLSTPESALSFLDVESGVVLRELGALSSFQWNAHLTPDGRTVLRGGPRGAVWAWDAGLAEDPFVLRGHQSFVYSVAVSPDGERLASAGWDGREDGGETGGANDRD